MTIQVLLRAAMSGGGRNGILAEWRRVLAGREIYAGSREELTPVRWDWLSALPLAIVALRLLANPAAAAELSRETARTHQLNLQSIGAIRERIASAR